MTSPFLHTVNQPKSLVADALARSAPLVVTFRHDDGWGVFKARILAVLEESNEVVLEYPDGGDGPVPELAPGQFIGIAFRKGHKKCIGDTCVRERCVHTSRSGQQIPAFTILYPEELYELQRRLFYRVEIPKNRPVDVELWTNDGNDAPPPDDIHRGTMIDLSVGGLSVGFTSEGAPQLEENQELTCAFLLESDPIRLNARVRYCNTSDSGMRCGLQFIGADSTDEGRQQLEHIARFVNYLQFQEKRVSRAR